MESQYLARGGAGGRGIDPAIYLQYIVLPI